MFCNHCGKKLNDEARFCTGCGNVVGKKVIPESQYAQSNAQSAQSNAQSAQSNAQSAQSKEPPEVQFTFRDEYGAPLVAAQPPVATADESKKKKMMLIGAIAAVVIVAIVLVMQLTGIKGVYVSESQRYCVEVVDGENCVWYQDGSVFTGTYQKVDAVGEPGDKVYIFSIQGSGGYSDTEFYALQQGSDFLIAGGTVRNEIFYKQ